jgi:hypothetical protein
LLGTFSTVSADWYSDFQQWKQEQRLQQIEQRQIEQDQKEQQQAHEQFIQQLLQGQHQPSPC